MNTRMGYQKTRKYRYVQIYSSMYNARCTVWMNETRATCVLQINENGKDAYKLIQLCLSPLLQRLGITGSESGLCVRLARFGVPDPFPLL
jgi:hypothetical protein